MGVSTGAGGQIITIGTQSTIVSPQKTVNVITGGTQGPIGPQGIQGVQGEAGLAGAGILTGAGVPSNSLGADEQYYVDSNVEDLYRKSSGVWSKITDLDDMDAGFF